MTKYGRLLRVFLKTSLFDLNPPGAKKYRAAGYGLLIFISVGALVAMLFISFNAMFSMGLPPGIAASLLAVLLLSALAITLIACLRSMLGMFSNSYDLDFLLSLPVSPRAIFAARYTRVYIGQVGMASLFLAPAMVSFLLHYGQDFPSWLMAVLFVLVAPAIPLGLSSLIAIGYSRVMRGRKRNETALGLVGILLTGALLILMYYFIGRMSASDMTAEQMQEMLIGATDYAATIASGFPPVDWAASAIAAPLSEGFKMLGFLLPSAAVTFVLIFAGGNFYAKYAAQMGGGPATRVRGGLSARRHSSFYAMALREWRGLLRSPLYAMNSLIMVIMGPILAILPVFMSEEFDLAELGTGVAYSQLSQLIAFILMAFVSMVNIGLATTISREGQTAYMLKIMPVSPGRQMAARIAVGVAIAAVANLLVAIVLPFAWPIGVGESLIVALVVTLAGIPSLTLCALPDMYHPKLDWQNEQQAMKQNMNGFLGMLAAMLGMVPHVVLLFLLVDNLPLALALSAALSLALIGVFYALLPRMANRAFQRI